MILAKKKNLTKEDIEDVSIFEGTSSQKGVFNPNKIRLNDLKIDLKCKTIKQKELRRAIEEKDVIIALGSPGTGKTYVSLMTAIHLMKTEPRFQNLVLIKSLQTINGEELGFLPGNVDEKILPYMNSYTSNLTKIFGSSLVTKSLIEKKVIEFYPISYIRGVTFSNSIIICDETQNITMSMFKTLITRIGMNSKYIFLGDPEQVDRVKVSESCLSKLPELFNGEDFIETIKFGEEDCVRNPIIPRILEILSGK